MDNFYAVYIGASHGNSGVISLNGLTGALSLVAGTGISITPAGSNITIASTGPSGVLPIANGGTNSSTALTNNKLMVSLAGKIVEALTTNWDDTTNTLSIYSAQTVVQGNRGFISQNNAASSRGGLFRGMQSRGSLSVPTATQLNDQLAAFSGVGYGTTGYSPNSNAQIQLFASENFTDSAAGARIEFFTTPVGSIVPALAVRIGGDSGLSIYNANSSFIKHLTPATTSYTLTWPNAQASGTQLLQNDGSGNLSWATAAAAGANTILSNLTSPTQVNQSLAPSISTNFDLGNSSFRWNNLTVKAIRDAADSTGGAGEVLTANGDNTFSWAAGGSGANVTLSNLTSPTAINQDLIINTGANAIIQTASTTGSLTRGLSLLSGSNSSGSGASGIVEVRSGSADTSSSGQVRVRTGVSNANTGQLTLATGNAGSSNSGDINMISGDSSALNSGSVVIRSGNSGGGSGSGNLELTTGNGSITGSILLTTGDGDTTDLVGDIQLRIGQDSSAPAYIRLRDGTEGTAGDIWISQDTLGGGQWKPVTFPSGNTASRPGSPVLAQCYFDTTLGIPIWYNGSNWVNALGATV